MSSKVALLVGSVPWLRGNISYHAANRASIRSTTTSSSRRIAHRVRRGRSARAISPRNSVGQHQRRPPLPYRPCRIPRAIARSRASSAPVGVLDRLLDEPLALDEFERDVLPGLLLLDQIVAPAFEMVGPGLDRVAPAPDPVRPEARRSSGHCRRTQTASPASPRPRSAYLSTARILSCPSRKMSAQTVDLVADDPLDRIAAGIDLGPDILDQDARVGPPFRAMSRVAPDIRARRDRHLPHRPRRRVQDAHIERRDPEARQHRRRLALRQGIGRASAARRSGPARPPTAAPAATTSRGSRSCVLTRTSARSSPLSVCRSSTSSGSSGGDRRRCGPSSLSAGTDAFMRLTAAMNALQVEALRLRLRPRRRSARPRCAATSRTRTPSAS